MTLDELKKAVAKIQYEPKRERCTCGVFPVMMIKGEAIYAYSIMCPECNRQGTFQRTAWQAVEAWNAMIKDVKEREGVRNVREANLC